MRLKIVFSVLLGLVVLFEANAQDPVCLPDQSYADSTAGVYPGPFHPEDFPDGGIHDTACVNHQYNLTFTAVVNDSIDFDGFLFKLNYLMIEEEGVLNLPNGLSYACNPPNCKFDANTMGCMIISGVPDDEVATYDLKLKSKIVALDGLLTISDTLPQLLIPGSHYYLVVDPEDSPHCQVNGDKRTLTDLSSLHLLKNPVNERILIKLNPGQGLDWELELLDFNGQRITIIEGRGERNKMEISLDELNLINGNYLLRLSSSKGTIVKKVVILADR